MATPASTYAASRNRTVALMSVAQISSHGERFSGGAYTNSEVAKKNGISTAAVSGASEP